VFSTKFEEKISTEENAFLVAKHFVYLCSAEIRKCGLQCIRFPGLKTHKTFRDKDLFTPVAEFIVPDWGDKVDSGIIYIPSQGL
jgi:hypothetical protein